MSCCLKGDVSEFNQIQTLYYQQQQQQKQAVDKEASRKSLMRMRNKSSVVPEAYLGDTKKCGIFYSYELCF